MINIRNYRSKLNLTQKELAKILKVSQSTIGMWENGERKPDIIMLKKLAEIFGCTADALLETINIKEEHK